MGGIPIISDILGAGDSGSSPVLPDPVAPVSSTITPKMSEVPEVSNTIIPKESSDTGSTKLTVPKRKRGARHILSDNLENESILG